MTSQSLETVSQPLHAHQHAAVFCTRCKTLLQVTDPLEKFTCYRKVTCPHCGQPHRMDLYFLGERDCFGLVPIRHQPAASALDEDD